MKLWKKKLIGYMLINRVYKGKLKRVEKSETGMSYYYSVEVIIKVNLALWRK